MNKRPSRAVIRRASVTQVTQRISTDMECIRLRVQSRTRELIDEAAALLGKKRSAFLIDCAVAQAVDALSEQRVFRLATADYSAFVGSLAYPPAAGAKLRALARHAAPWPD